MEHDCVRVGTWMQRKQDNIQTGGGEGSVMVSDWGCGCKENRTMYGLKVERERGGVGLGMQM